MESKSVLLSLESGNYYTLNRTGTYVWSLLDGKMDVQRIAGMVAGEFGVEVETALDDVRDLLEVLEKEGLVELGDGPV